MTRNQAESNTTKRTTRPQPTALQEVEKAKLLMQLQAELTTWAKSRLWVISIVGALGLWAIFQATLNSLIQTSLQKPVEDALKGMQTRSEEYTERLKSEIQRVDQQKDETTQAMLQLNALRATVDDAVRKELSTVQDAQTRLDATVTNINLLQGRLDKMKADVEAQGGEMTKGSRG